MKPFLTPRLALLALAHFTSDAYSSFFSPLLPLLVAKLHLSLTLVGTLVALASVSSSFGQPVFGYISDRLHRPYFVAFGPLVAALFMSAIGLAPSFGALVALLMLGGLGVAAFHPQAAVLAGEASPRRAMAMSLFVSGGTLGFAIGPLFAVSVVGALGLERTWLAAFPGVIVATLLLAWFLRVPSHVRHPGAKPSLRELKPHALPLTLLYCCVVCRSAVSYGFMTFLPIHLHRLGFSLGAGGGVMTAYLTAGALGGFAGGWLAERWGGRRVVIASFIGAIPLYGGFLILPGTAGLASPGRRKPGAPVVAARQRRARPGTVAASLLHDLEPADGCGVGGGRAADRAGRLAGRPIRPGVGAPRAVVGAARGARLRGRAAAR